MTRKYPDRFVVESKNYKWDVTYNPQTDYYVWKGEHSSLIYSEGEMDVFNRDHYKFVFPEPELVFPFTMKEQKGDGCHYRVTKEAAGIYLYDLDSTWASHANLYSEESIKRLIKSGEWVVQSVGEPKPAEAPQSDVKTTCVGTLTIDTTEALARIKELTEAVDNLTDAYANLGATMKRFNNV